MKTILITIAAALLASCGTSSTAGVKPYTKTTCLVTGNDLGSMGTPYSEVYQGQEVKFCCKPCVKKFHANPEKYLKKL